MKCFYRNPISIQNVEYCRIASVFLVLETCFKKCGRILSVLLLALATTYSMNACATMQWPDEIIFHGRKYMVHTLLLEKYFSEHKNLKLESLEVDEDRCTCLWRGYIATYEIKNNVLTLKGIIVPIWHAFSIGELATLNGYTGQIKRTGPNGTKKWKNILPELVSHAGPDVVSMKWYSGTLVIPDCDPKKCKAGGHVDGMSYILIEIKNGIFIKEKRVNDEEYGELDAKGLLSSE